MRNNRINNAGKLPTFPQRSNPPRLSPAIRFLPDRVRISPRHVNVSKFSSKRGTPDSNARVYDFKWLNCCDLLVFTVCDSWNAPMFSIIIIIIIIKRQLIRRSYMATRALYNVRCSYSGNS